MTSLHAMLSLCGFGVALANHLWQSSLFVVAVWLTSILLRGNAARIRYWLWAAASLKFLFPLSALIELGGLFAEPHVVIPPRQDFVRSALTGVGQPFVPPASSAAHPPAGASYGVHGMVAWLPMELGIVWLVGASIVLLVWVLRWRSFSAVVHRAVPVQAGRELEILRGLEDKFSMRGLRIRYSLELTEPSVFGVFRPFLLWPKRLSQRLSDEQIQSILAHEIMHVQRRDNLLAGIHMLVEALFWFHPMVWWIEKRMIEEREHACDEAAVECGASADNYAEGLLRVCRFCVESKLICVSGVSGADLKRRIQSILFSRRRDLKWSGKLAICLLVIMPVIAPVALGLMQKVPVYLQILQKKGPQPSFEVATIRPSKPNEQPMVNWNPRAGFFTAEHQSLRELIRLAYWLRRDDQIVSAPSWASREYFDVRARTSPAEAASLRKLSTNDAMNQFSFMLQSLLAKRFHLVVSITMRKRPVYALVVSGNGPKLKQVKVSSQLAKETDPPPPLAPPPPPSKHSTHAPARPPAGPYPGFRQTGPHQITATECRMAWLASWLDVDPELANRPVIDRTGLTGNYNFVLHDITIRHPAQPVFAPTPPDEGTISIFGALRKDLGLKLVREKAPIEVLVIDHLNRHPSPN